MPEMNGTHYRSYGQGARAEKEKASKPPITDATSGQDEKKSGDVTAIKDHGDGSYSVKHPDGEISKHASKDELMSHLDEHFGGGEEEYPDSQGDDSDFGSEGSSEALKTLLG